MCNAIAQPFDSFRPWFCPVMTRPAQGNQVFKGVGIGHRPRDNVVNVKAFACSRHFRLLLAAAPALVTVCRTRPFGNRFPVWPALIVLRRAALPLMAGTARHSAISRRYVAGMGAKLSCLTIKGAKWISASFAFGGVRPCARPPRAMVASHIAKLCVFGPVLVNAKGISAPLACAINLGKWPALAASGASVPRRPPILAGALSRTVFSRIPTDERLSALCAGVMNGLCHAGSISGTRFNINYFDIACRRVDEATRQPDLFVAPPTQAPKQEPMI